MNLCHQIKKYRTELNLSQKELAEKIYVSTQTISNWENERSYPDVQNLLLMSGLFDVTLDDLVKGDVEEMKKCIERKEMKRWAWIMAVFSILFAVSIGVVSILPDKLVWWGILVSFTLGISGFYASLKIEKIKKSENTSTYQEIIAYFAGEDVEELRKLRDKKKDRREKILIIILFASVGAIIGIVTLLVANYFV